PSPTSSTTSKHQPARLGISRRPPQRTRRRRARRARRAQLFTCASSGGGPASAQCSRGVAAAFTRHGAGGHLASLASEPTGRSGAGPAAHDTDRKSTRLNSSHVKISYAVFCLKKKKNSRTIARAHGESRNFESVGTAHRVVWRCRAA